MNLLTAAELFQSLLKFMKLAWTMHFCQPYIQPEVSSFYVGSLCLVSIDCR